MGGTARYATRIPTFLRLLRTWNFLMRKAPTQNTTWEGHRGTP